MVDCTYVRTYVNYYCADHQIAFLRGYNLSHVNMQYAALHNIGRVLCYTVS